jgi:hypothetical protein
LTHQHPLVTDQRVSIEPNTWMVHLS